MLGTDVRLVLNIRRVGALAVISALAACSPQLEAEVYLADVVDASASSGEFFVPLTLKIPQTSSQKCAEDAAVLFEAVAKVIGVTEQGTCVTEGYDTFAQFALDAPILTYEQATSEGFEMPFMALVVSADKNDEREHISLALILREPMSQTVDAVKAQNNAFRYAPSVDTPIIEISLQNDLRFPVVVSGITAFVNDAPDIGGQEYSLDRRDALQIQLSDVASTYIANGGGYFFAAVNVPVE